MIFNLNKILDNIDETTIKFNGSILWVPNLNKYICAFRAIKKPFSKFLNNIPNYPYMWIDEKFWYNNLNYIGIILLNEDFTILENTFRKYYHTFKDLDLIELDSKGISYSGPEDPRLYFKSDGQPYMLYNTIVPEKLMKNCKKQCVGMYEIKIKPSYFLTNNKTTELYDTSNRQIICLNILDKLAYDNKGKVHFKNITPSSEIERDVDYYIDNLNNYNIMYKQKKDEENFVCSYKENMKINNTNNIIITNNLKDIFNKNIRKHIHASLTSPEIRLDKEKEEFLGVAHIRIKYKYILENIDSLSPEFKKFVNILNTRVNMNFIQHNNFYFMLFYLRNKDSQIISYSNPFIPEHRNLETNVLYNVFFPTGLTRKNDYIIISYGKGDCLFNLLVLKNNTIKKMLKNKKLTLNDLSITYHDINHTQNFSELQKDLKIFLDETKKLINIL